MGIGGITPIQKLTQRKCSTVDLY